MKLLWLIDRQSEATPERLTLPRWTVKLAWTLDEALAELAAERDAFAACVVCLDGLEPEPCDVFEALVDRRPGLPVIFVREAGQAAEAVALLKLGAWHYFDRVPESEDFESLLELLPRSLPHSEAHAWRRALIGESPEMRQVVEMIQLIADRRSTVLVLGETGTGKEVVARAIHAASSRARNPIVAINCAAIPEDLLEAELFGHVKGAFTGATNARMGRFEQAHQSTLLLDEVGDMPLDLQAKLLRALQEREIQRVGSAETIRVDVRVIAATNADLYQRVKSGRFREDLYYRLNVVPVRIPPLRERPADIPQLVHHCIEKVCDAEHLPRKTIAPETVQRLAALPWPGNVRQLENAVEMAVVLSGERTLLAPGDFSVLAQAQAPAAVTMTPDQLIELPAEGLDFEAVIGRIELNLLEQALQRANGNKKVAADLLRLKRTTLAAKLKSLEPLATASAV